MFCPVGNEDHLNPIMIWFGGVPQGSILMSYIIVREAFTENSAATHCKLVELLFSAKGFHSKRILGLMWLNERDPYLFTLIKVKIYLTINVFTSSDFKKIRFRFKFD